jgi:hypothetical protein
VKRLLTQVSALCGLLAVLLFAHIAPATADGWPHHHGKHHAQVAYTDWCRVGWWQSLYYGHVRPRWEARCR